MAAQKRRRPNAAYPIRIVARLTGLSPDLIRAWERRYGVVRPARDAHGARLYSEADVSHLRSLARVVAEGRAIGDVAALDDETLEALASTGDSRAERGNLGDAVQRILAAVVRLDTERVEHQLEDALVALGGTRFVHEIAAPLLTRVGEEWSAGRLSVAAEHLVSGLLRNVICSLVRTRRLSRGPSILLATPRGERHEFGLLLVAFLATNAGTRSYYLGTDLPADEIMAAVHLVDVTAVCLGAVYGGNRRQAAREVQAIVRGLPASSELWLGGRDAPQLGKLLRRERLLVLDDLTAAEAELARLGRGAATLV
jgi:DNA-binding transcriptional MerR regulator/methylmalonyl-CoA mutase cobalamin-binding subunit